MRIHITSFEAIAILYSKPPLIPFLSYGLIELQKRGFLRMPFSF